MTSIFSAVSAARPTRASIGASAEAREDTARILNIPLRAPREAPDQTSLYAKTGKYRLRPIQSHALLEAGEVGGLYGPIGVGHGKSIISFLMPEALRLAGYTVRRPMLLTPSALTDKAVEERFELLPHLKIDTQMRILSYEKLSTAKATDLLDRLRPDLIVCDEAHAIANRNSSRARRFMRYARENPDCRFAFLSGSFSNDSIEEYAHLVLLALRDNAPVPKDRDLLKAWSAVLDPSGKPKPEHYAAIRPLLDWAGRSSWSGEETRFQDMARESYNKRLLWTRGVVSTSDSAIDSKLTLKRVDVTPPPVIVEELERLESTWCRPDGEELEDAIAMARNRLHLLQGFYHVWDWPNGVVDEEWMEARAAWHKAVRNFLQSPRATAHLDSPLLLRRWVNRGHAPCSCDNGCSRCSGTGRVRCTDWALIQAWTNWDKVRHRPQPPVKVVWVDKYLVWASVQQALLMEEEGGPTIVWSNSTAMHQELAKHLPSYGPGEVPPRDNPHTCVMSVRSHGTGRNLQAWKNNLLTLFIGNNKRMEQLIGRTHRPGQEGDVLMAYLHPHESMDDAYDKAMAQARYIEATKGMAQKLLMADIA